MEISRRPRHTNRGFRSTDSTNNRKQKRSMRRNEARRLKKEKLLISFWLLGLRTPRVGVAPTTLANFNITFISPLQP